MNPAEKKITVYFLSILHSSSFKFPYFFFPLVFLALGAKNKEQGNEKKIRCPIVKIHSYIRFRISSAYNTRNMTNVLLSQVIRDDKQYKRKLYYMMARENGVNSFYIFLQWRIDTLMYSKGTLFHWKRSSYQRFFLKK